MEARYAYATAGEVQIAYAVFGDAGPDLVVVPGMASHLDLFLSPPASYIFERLAAFSRVIIYDKRGTGLSDPVTDVPTLDVRMEEISAVMGAAGSDRAIVFGISEGSAMALLFAATHPERVSSLILYGALAKSTWAPDYPWANRAEDMAQAGAELILPYWGTGIWAESTSPSEADNPKVREWYARFERMAASPAMLTKLFAMYMDIDVRNIVSSVHVPTLLLHRRGDRLVNVRNARWLAEHMPDAKYIELEGIDHSPVSGNQDQIVDEIERFVTGSLPSVEPDRVLATVMFTDIVGSTERASELGDMKWREVLEAQQRIVRGALERFRGAEIKTTGDGFLATFDGPVRAIHCAQAIVTEVGSLGVEVRVGLHTGEIELMDGDIGGIAVHIASRVGSAASAREILVSDTVKGIVAGSGISFVERGEHELKGVPEPWRLYTVSA